MFQFLKSATKTSRVRTADRLAVEHLEARELMATGLSASLNAGILSVQESAPGNTIHIREAGNQITIDGALIAVGSASQAAVGAAAVSGIVLHGVGGNDQVWVGTAGATLPPVTLLGAVGGDKVITPGLPGGVSLGATVTKAVVAADGTTFELTSDGTLSRTTTPGSSSFVALKAGVTNFDIDTSGNLFALAGGTLSRTNAHAVSAATAWTQIYSSQPPWATPGYPYPTVSSYSFDDTGKLTILTSDGSLSQGAADTVTAAYLSGGWSTLLTGSGQHVTTDAAGNQFLVGWNGELVRGTKNP